MRRLGKFLRSVLPTDWTQLIFLFGIICLYVARILRSWPAEEVLIPPKHLPFHTYMALFLGAHMPLLAGVAGYFICFWPGKRPARRILYWVCLPALGGLSLTYGLFLYYGLGPSSAKGNGKYAAHTIGWALSALWSLGPEFHFALLGLILVALFAWRLAAGGVHPLPLALPESSVPLSDDPTSWRRVQILVWILVALAGGPLFISIGLVLTGIFYPIVVFLPSIARLARLPHLSGLVAGLIRGIGAIGGYLLLASASLAMVLVFAFLTLGKEGRQDLRRAVRLPKPEYFLLALAFPFAIATFIAAVWHLFPLVQIEEVLPGIFFAAFLEELIFRGLLQPRFIRRYGLLRGIFLVGIVWAAAHFYGDFSLHFSHGNVLLRIGSRLLDGVAFSFILGWFPLRTRWVLPATVAHGFENLFIVTYGSRFLALGPVRILLWGALALMLFRYWPVQAEAVQKSGAAIASPTPQL